MNLIRRDILVFLLLFSAVIAMAQRSSNSPFTRFGYGEIAEPLPTELNSMGGISLGNRSENTINSYNPASYSGIDSLTFMFDVGVSGKYSRFSDNKNSNSSFNGNIDYITLRFPITKYLGVSFGLIPYSNVGYNFSQVDSTELKQHTGIPSKFVYYNQSFTGSGGLAQAYGGLAVKLFDHISLGFNTYYLFGEINNSRHSVFADEKDKDYKASIYSNKMKASDVRFRYGVQFYNTFARKHNVVIGAIYEQKKRLNNRFEAVLNNKILSNNNEFELPQTFGVGANYVYNDKLTIGVDFVNQNWGDAQFMGRIDTLKSSNRWAVGAEYIPNPRGRNYSDRIRYRVGFNTNNQYYSFNDGKPMQDFGISFGVGLPTLTSKSFMNFGIEYKKVGSSSLLREDYIKVSFSASINELWFFKPKI